MRDDSASPLPARVPPSIERWGFAFLIILYAFIGIASHDLWTPDEPRVAALGKEVAAGAWVIPTLNEAPFLEQPPLHAWMVATTFRVLGTDPPWIARIPSVLCGLGGLAAVYFLARHLARVEGAGDPRSVAFAASLALGLAYGYFTTSHRVVVDGALTLFTTLSTLALVRGVDAAGPGRRTAWLALGYGFASVAFLAKGLMGVAVPALALAALALARRRPGLLWKAQPWLAPLAFGLVTGPWFYLLYEQSGWVGFKEIFLENTIERIVSLDNRVRGHMRPLLFYVWNLPMYLAPLTLVLAASLWRRFRARETLAPGERRIIDFAAIWLALGFAMLSASSTKRPIYLVPFFPVAAIASAPWLVGFLSGALGTGRVAYAGWRGFAILLGVVSMAIPFAKFLLPEMSMGVAIPCAAISLALTIGLFSRAGSARTSGVFAAAVLASGALACAVDFAVIPAADGMKSLAGVSRAIDLATRSAGGDALPLHAIDPDETTEAMMPFYVSRPIRRLADREAFREALAREGVVYLVDLSKRRNADGSPRWESGRFLTAADPSPETIFVDLGANRHARAFRVLRFR